MNAIMGLLKAFLPTLVAKAVEVATSKKAVATVLTYVGVTATSDWKQQVTTAAIGVGYTLAQGLVDMAKAKAPAAK